MRRLLLWMMCCVWAVAASAAGMQDLGRLEALAGDFLRHELSMRPATWTLGQLDRKLAVPACAQPKADWATPGVTTGATFVAVSCPELGWALRIPVRINEKKMGVALSRAVAAGEVLSAADVRLVDVANPSLARNVLDDLQQAIGKTMRSGAPAGAWLRSFMVRAPYLVNSNQRVKVVASGEGFAAAADGLAIGNAAEGEQVSVRMASGRVIRGQVQADGSVMVIY
ncbi:flagellar basal body P-ring formation chaperone FlgA [Chromobacterium haemolyticum]|uniref:flagellar basal body P-ring formation chaperone FlgA n=1 Tax=Chromobacterium haemolyticum TaxID=394935 RepID=UPI001F0826A0|nr:flagellar basal body P-ring formation chaperone FlgA [Chromobacterium haemolyticum]